MARIARLENPYTRPGRWYKGAFHFHTTNSDGKISPVEAVRRYAARGFRVVGISDHGFVTRLPAGTVPGVLLIPTNEVAWPHLLHIGARGTGKVHINDPRKALAAVRRDRGFSVFCHPSWSNCGRRLTDLMRGSDAFEIYNHVTEFENARGYSVERWDEVLEAGWRIWGFADDDSHFNKWFPQYAGGWVMIRTPRLTQEAVLAAMRAGSYYSSMGPEFRAVTVDRGTVRVRTSPVVEVRAIADGVGAGSVLFSKQPRTSWTIRYGTWWCQPRRYLRIELKDRKGRTAWSNPLFVRTA